MKKYMFGAMLCLTLSLLPAVSLPAAAAEAVSYMEYSWNSGTSTLSSAVKSTSDYTVVDANTTAWESGKTYVVNGTVTIDTRVTIEGSVNLILTDDCELTVNGGIEVLDSETLTIYAQSYGTGKLTATASGDAAAIGGTSKQNGGTVNVHGGTVTATATGEGSGIGGSSGGLGGAGGTVNVYNGSVAATGMTGIGGGYGVLGSGGTTNVYGGFVTAIAKESDGSGDSGAGIGGVGVSGVNNSASSTNIYGGVVTAIGGDGYHKEHGLYYMSAGIGGGHGNRGGTVTISGGIVNAEAGKDDRGSPTDAIGNGENGSGVAVTRIGGMIFENDSGKLYGTTFTMPVDYSTPTGKTLTVDKGKTLTVPAGKILIVNGPLVNNGTIQNNRSLILGGSASQVSGSGHIKCQKDSGRLTLGSGIYRTTSNGGFQTAVGGTTAVEGAFDHFEYVGAGHLTVTAADANGHTVACKDTSCPLFVSGIQMDHDMSGNVCTDCGYTFYDIWVGGVQVGGVPDANGKITVTGDTITGTVTLTPASATVDAPNTSVLENAPTLTLSGASITAAQTPVDVAYGNTPPCGIYSKSALNLVLTGANTITASTTDYSAGVKADAMDLAISGDGSLEINNCGHGIQAKSLVTDGVTVESIGSVYAISLNTGCTIEDSTVSAVGSARGISTINGTIGIDNSSVYAEGGNYSFYGSQEVVVCLSGGAHVKAEGAIGVQGGVTSANVGYLRTESGGEFARKEGSLETGSGYFEFVGEGHLGDAANKGDGTHSYSCACVEGSGMQATNVATEAHRYTYEAKDSFGLRYFTEACETCDHGATTSINVPGFPTYDGNPKQITVSFNDGWAGEKNQTIQYRGVKSTEYGPSDVPPTDAGSYAADITVNGATFSGVSFTIKPLDISSSAAITLGNALTYNGREQAVAVSKVEAGGLTLASNDYTVSGNTQTNAGDYTLTVTGQGNFTGDATTTWRIAPAPLTITAANQIIPTGGELDQTKYLVTGLMEGHTLTGVKLNSDGVNISIDRTNVKILDAGSNEVTDNYSISLAGGSVTATTKTIVDINLTIPADLTYDGTDLSGKVTQKITATLNDQEVDITLGENGEVLDGFVYSYSADPVNAGEYMIVVNVSGNNARYAGTATYPFTIAKATPTGAPAYTKITASGKTLAEAGLTTEGGTFSVDGAVAWGLPETTTVAANTAYTWVFTPADTVNYNTLTGTVTLYSVSTSSSGGGSSSGSTSAPVVSTDDKTEEGTTTTTTTATPSATTRGDTASATVSTSVGKEMVEQAKENESAEVVIAPKVTGDVTRTEVSIPASTVESIGGETAANLTVSTPVANVTIPNGGLSDLASAGGTVTVTAEKVGNTVTLDVTAGGETVSEVAGGITLTVPHDDCAPGTVAVLVHEDGSREVVRKSVADDGTLTVTIPLDGSATLELVDNSKSFEDVAGDAWYSDAVDFVSARGLFTGIGGKGAIFDGEGSMTRGMLAVVLHRLENEPEHAFTGSFDDVAEGAWYTEAVLWMAEAGIAGGYGNGDFGAEDSITREQLAVMLWRYAGSPAPEGSTLNFTDADEASGWAVDALIWAQETGVMQGSNGAVDPKGTAARAHVAQMLQNFVEVLVK